MKWKEALTQQKNTNMLHWIRFWMILLVLHEGFGIDQPYREVKGTTCQEIVKQPNYQARLPCTGKDVKYHCLLNEENTVEYEVCREWKWIPKDKCAYFNTYGSGNVDERDCKSTPDLPCAVKEYDSADNTQYAACYVKKEMTTVPILETSSRVVNSSTGENSSLVQTPPTNSIRDEQSHPGSALGITFGIFIPFILVAAVLLMKYGNILDFRKGSKEKIADFEAHPEEVKKLLENKEEKKKDVENERNESKGNKQTLDIERYPSEEDLFEDCKEEVEKQDKENKWKDVTNNSMTEYEDEEVKSSKSSSSEDKTGNTETDDKAEGNHHPPLEEPADKRKEETEKNYTDQKEYENTENKLKKHDNNILNKESTCSKTDNVNLIETKNQLSSMHGKDSSAQGLEEVKGQKNDSPSQHADGMVNSKKGKLNNSASPFPAEANVTEATANGKGHPIDRVATGEANSKDDMSAESDRRGSLSDEQVLPGKKEESVGEKEGSTHDEDVREESIGEKEGSKGDEEGTTYTSDEYKAESTSENVKGTVESLAEDEPTAVFDDTVESLQKESVDKKDKEYCQELYDFLNEVFTNPARTLFKSVLSKNVEKSPAEILKDASIQTELKEELPPEYHASISPEGEDNESVIILNCLLRKYLKEKESPNSGWGEPVKSTDTGIGDDVERLCRVYTIIREISDPGKIPVENYERLLNVVFDAFKRLDANEKFKDDHNKLIKKVQDIRNLHRSQESNAFVLQ